MTRYVIDAYAWIEYLDGTEKGRRVKEIVENQKNEIYTNLVTLTELLSKFIRKNKDPENASKAVHLLSKIYYGDEEFAKLTAEIHADIKKKINDFGLADAFVIATGRKNLAKIVTGDEKHFKNIPNTILI